MKHDSEAEIVLYQKVLRQIKICIQNKINQGKLNIVQIGLLGEVIIYNGKNVMIRPKSQLCCKFIIKNSEQYNQLLKLDQKQINCINLNNKNSCIYEQVGRKLSLSDTMIYNIIDNYIKAGLQIAQFDPERLVEIDLGVFSLHFQNRIISFSKAQMKQKTCSTTKRKLYKKLIQDSSDLKQAYTKRWEDSLLGCLQENLHLKKIQQNLDKGQSLMKKYGQKQ